MARLEIQVPEGCILESGPVRDYPLLPGESACLEGAVEQRRRQFASGRHFARLAMQRLAGYSAPILRDAQGRPLWPDGFTGSISHSNRHAAAVVSNGAVRGIGIDVEDADRLDRANPRLHRKLFTDAERSAGWTDTREGSIRFSAKEAAYKAINPLAGRYIGFREVEADIDWRRRSFRIRYLGDHEPNRLIERGAGHFHFFGDQVLTLFCIE